MFWRVLVVAVAAVIAYFIPTPMELKEAFKGGQNLMAASNYKLAIEKYDYIIATESKLMTKDTITVNLFDGELAVKVYNAAFYQKANALKSLKNTDSALKVFKYCEALKGDSAISALAQFQIYDIYYTAKDFVNAISEARKLVKKYPKHKKAEAALYDVAWAYREMKLLDSSNVAFLELIDKFPSTDFLSKAYFQLGQNDFEMGNFDESVHYWTILQLKFKPESFKEKDWENVQLKSNREKKMFDAFSGRETDASTLELVAKAQVKIGDAYRKMNNYDSSMYHYRKVINSYALLPMLIEATYVKMADYTTEIKGVDAGVAVYRAAIDENFKDKEFQAKMQFKIAELYQNKKMYAQAGEAYHFYAAAYSEVAQQINFSVEDALYSEIAAYFNGDLFKFVVEHVDSFLNLYPASLYGYDVLFYSGISSFNLKEAPAAAATFRKVIARNPVGQYFIPSHIYISRLLFDEKKHKDAIGILDTVYEAGLNSRFRDELMYYLIQNHYELKNYDTVPFYFAKIEPKSPYFVPAIIKTAKCFTLQKKFDAGEKFIKGLLVLADSLKDSVNMVPETRYAYADLLIAQQKNEEAVQSLSIVIADSKTNELLKLQSVYLRGSIYGTMGKHKEAIADLDSVLNNAVFQDKMKAFVPNARGRLATAYAKTGNLKKGTDLLLSYVNAATDSLDKVRYLVALCELNFENNKFKDVIPFGEQVLASSVQDEYLYSRAAYLTSSSYNSVNDFAKALNIMIVASDKYPDANKEIFFNFAVRLYDNNYLENAAVSFSKYIEKYPASPLVKNARFFTAYAYYKLGKWDESVTGFRAFLKDYPQDEYAAEAQYNIAEAFFNQGNFKDAIKEYDITVANYKATDFAPAAIYNSAWCYYQLKEIDKMIAPLQKLINEYPKSPLIPEAQFTIGDYYYNSKQYSKALKEYRTFVEKFPEHAKTEEARSFIKDLAQIDAFKAYQAAIQLFDKKEYQNAITELQKIVNDYPDSEVALACKANIGSSYEQMGDKAKALEVFKSIVEQHKNDPNAAGVVFFAQQHIEWIEGNETAIK